MRIVCSILVAALAASAHADCLVPYWSPVATLGRTAEFVTTADFDGDGKVDVAGNTATTIFITRNNGTGGLATPADVHTGTIRGSIAAAELTGDAHVDLVFPSGDSLMVLPGNGDGTFAAAIESTTTIAPQAIAIARFDPDNASDVATFDPALAVLVLYANDGAGHFTERTRMALRAGARSIVAADIDGDSWIDVVAGYATSSTMDAFYGRSDGAFDAGTIRGTSPVHALHTGDLDGNGLLDLTTSRYYGVLAAMRNLGSRAFGDPLIFTKPGDNYDHELAELTGDAHLDVIGAGEGRQFWTWSGTGLGTFTRFQGTDLECSWTDRPDTATGDFDSDGRRDVVIAEISEYEQEVPRVTLYRNLCGDGRIQATTQSPLISIGQDVTINVRVLAPLGVSSGIAPTGNVSIRKGDTILATASVASFGNTPMLISGLTPGEHTLTVSYAGDSQYEPLETTITIDVTSETTTTTLEATPAEGVYGIAPEIVANVTSSTGGTPTGPLRMFIEGQPYNVFTYNAPTATYSPAPSHIGTFTFVAEFLGDATHPPSRTTLTYEIGKATPKITMDKSSGVAGGATTVSVTVYRTAGNGEEPDGTITIGEGSQTFGTYTLSDAWGQVTFNLPALSIGTHHLRISYSGDSQYNATEDTLPFVIFPSGQRSIDARGTAEAVRVTWLSDQLIIRRRAANETWAQASYGSCCPNAPWLDTNALPETPYLYRMEGHDYSVSHADLGMRIAFTDDPLAAGVKIKAAHLTEIVRAANIVRAAAQLSPIDVTANAGGHLITAAQVLAVRESINQARVALGAIPFAFTGMVAPGAVIRASHIQELREAVR
ncbi:MAG TPA: Ig-like domain repeat protein [Thermoanaerobaculia bacterium]|nr:Ig-like domain repeat protein [Thermoanaerobaculia bacterium]